MAAPQTVIIGFHGGDPREYRALVEQAGGTLAHEYRLIQAVVATIPEENLVMIQRHPLVSYVEPDGEMRPVETNPEEVEPGNPLLHAASAETDGKDEYQAAWGVAHIGARAAHQRGITGAGVKIAIIDSGIDYTHVDLSPNYAGGYDFVNDDADPMDDTYNSHGTNVAGIIAAGYNGFGVVGVAPEASIYALKVLTSVGTGLVSTTVAAIEWAVENGMDIVNISIQGEHRETLEAACNAAADAGLLIVAAAGNTRGQPASYPAAYDTVVAVTATDKDDTLPPFTPRDTAVELAAPGTEIYSTARVTQGKYIALDGTSQAAPHVAGLAALILSSGKLTDRDRDGDIDNHDLRLALQAAAKDLGDEGRDELFGYGLVDVGTALLSATEFRMETERSWLSGWQRKTVQNGEFHILVHNESLTGIIMLVLENGKFRHDLSRIHLFPTIEEPKSTPDPNWLVDASGTTLELLFVPFGKEGASARVVIIE